MEFEHSKKRLLWCKEFSGASGSVTIIDKRLSAKEKKDFDRLYGALDEFNALADKLIVREHKADRVAETVSKCKVE